MSKIASILGYSEGHAKDTYNNPYDIGSDEWEDYMDSHDLGEQDSRIEKGYWHD